MAVRTQFKNKCYDLFIDIALIYIDATHRDAAERRRETTGHARDFSRRTSFDVLNLTSATCFSCRRLSFPMCARI